mmetsp:Transcript_10970/g.15232  ORF Transcript_10970/g.15232 Transcript_10970/m.15232 type:complete len:155 (-) Transcript_10970:13-477(-)
MLANFLLDQAEKYRISTELHPLQLSEDFFQYSSELDLDDMSTNSELEDDATHYERTLADEQEEVEEECDMQGSMETFVSFQKSIHGSNITSQSGKNNLPHTSKEVNQRQLRLTIDGSSTNDEPIGTFSHTKGAGFSSIIHQQQKGESCEDKPKQ